MASKKKSPGPVRMKPWKGFCLPDRNGRVLIAFHENDTFFNREGTVPVLVTELGTSSADERIDRLLKWCSEQEKRQCCEIACVYTDDIRAVLNAKPGRKR